jgi:hypothetical protein
LGNSFGLVGQCQQFFKEVFGVPRNTFSGQRIVVRFGYVYNVDLLRPQPRPAAGPDRTSEYSDLGPEVSGQYQR